MEPTTFKLYKISKKQNTIYLVLTITMLIIGIAGFIIQTVSDIEFFMGNTTLHIMLITVLAVHNSTTCYFFTSN